MTSSVKKRASHLKEEICVLRTILLIKIIKFRKFVRNQGVTHFNYCDDDYYF